MPLFVLVPLTLVALLMFRLLALSFPGIWHNFFFFFVHLQSVKMMPRASGPVARTVLRQKYQSARKHYSTTKELL